MKECSVILFIRGEINIDKRLYFSSQYHLCWLGFELTIIYFAYNVYCCVSFNMFKETTLVIFESRY